jgi:SAM-dependent methyltransferase
MNAPVCRSCGSQLRTTFVDLGVSPLSNSYVPLDRAREGELFYPLHALVCDVCFLVQLEAFETPEAIFGDYAYLSSMSTSWLAHSERYVNAAIERLGLNENSLVAEAASNDGYLLQYFVRKSIPVLGVEPARNVAAIANDRGVRTVSVFLGGDTGSALAREYGRADLVVANNVIAHVPDVHDFVDGLRALLAEGGTITVEFPHLLRLINEIQYDTIYHEHFSYFSLHALTRLLKTHALKVIDVEELPTHGGSLRVWVAHESDDRNSDDRVTNVLEQERAARLLERSTYESFTARVLENKAALLEFLIGASRQGKRVVGYGAPAKGNTLLNYCGIKRDQLAYTVDRNPLKQNTLLPGSRIPVFAPELIEETKPDYVLILPWNIRDEVEAQLANIRAWGGKFVVATPQLEIF